jgi:hypothetical protein
MPGRGGRPPGVRSHALYEGRKRALEILNDPRYKALFDTMLTSGNVSDAMHRLLWAYGFGKPVVNLEVSMPKEDAALSQKSDAELAEKADSLRSEILERASRAQAKGVH